MWVCWTSVLPNIRRKASSVEAVLRQRLGFALTILEMKSHLWDGHDFRLRSRMFELEGDVREDEGIGFNLPSNQFQRASRRRMR